jgi:four helix bundle protein
LVFRVLFFDKPMAFARFQNLVVYQLSEELADTIWDIVCGWGALARDTVGKQIVRSADSIGTNIAEGCGRKTVDDARRFVRIARGSLLETQHWLRRAYRRKLLTPKQVDSLQATVEALAPKLNAYLRSIGKNDCSRSPNPKH